MKASTLFVICIALFIGLAAAAGAKYVGLFEKTAKVDTKNVEEPMMVLVANNDLYPGLMITSNDVRVRELTPDEKSGNFAEKNKGKLLPANVLAANMRVPNRKINADEPLRREMFNEELPEPVTLRLADGMGAVNVSVPRGRSAGGVIQLGEYVNVNLTSRVTDGNGKTSIQTAPIAKNCRVIMKRDTIYQRLGSDGDTIPFTLEANPYRAALIDFAQHKGELSLVPVYNAKANIRKSAPDRGMPVTYSEMGSEEYGPEDSRVTAWLKGDYRIGDADMARLFKIQGPTPMIYVDQVVGITRKGVQTFNGLQSQPGKPATGTPGTPGAPATTPSDPGVSSLKDDKECKTCKKEKGLNEPLYDKK